MAADEETSNLNHLEREQDTPHTVVTTTVPEEEHCNVRSYLTSSDFREIIYCFVFLLISVAFFAAAPSPRTRPIPYQLLENSLDYVRNLVNNEENTGDTVSDLLLIVLSRLLPLLTQIVLSKTRWAKPRDTHNAICVYFCAFALTLIVTNCIKLYVGYLRPIFYSTCQPDDNYQECTQDSSEVRKSFISGHASDSFCGLTILTLYLYNRFGMPSVRVYKMSSDTRQWVVEHIKAPTLYRFLSIAALLPMALATFIASSRVVDNKHFPADVVGGSILGTAFAIFTNSLWYTS
jgi:diacylglycerol diphosphate phosphatase/phosphatidate phosphatase